MKELFELIAIHPVVSIFLAFVIISAIQAIRGKDIDIL